MKHCLTREQVVKAWELEKEGAKRAKVAMRFFVSERTLLRLYRAYGLPSPKKRVKK